MTYGNGNYVTYSYDKYGNVVAQDSYNDEDETTASYRAYADNTGTIIRAQDLINNLEYNTTYDSIGRLISSTVTDMSTNKFKSAYEYKFDENNNVKRFVSSTPNGSNATSYTYIKDNLPKYAYFTGGRKLTNNYDNLGRLIDTTIDTSTNIHTDYTYLDSNVSGYTTNFVETETNGDFSYKYEYDANGNITKLYRKDSNNNYVLSEEYTYNALGELTQVDYLDLNKRYKYSYDSGGNISKEKEYTLSNGTETLQSTNDYDYEDLNWHDKLTSYKGTTITYDSIGNPLSYRNGMSFTWENGRQLHTYTKNGQTATYSYDANGTRLKKDVNGVIHTYLYNGSQLLQETKGTKILDYSYDSNGQIYAVRYRVNANDEGTYYYYAHNTRGDIVGLYNADGTLHAKYTYDVWGNKLAVTNASGVAITSQTDIANLQPFRYRGYYYDYESGFYYLQSRYYDPVTHRFINADGLVSTGTGVLGFNMFAYCENNPVNCIDTNGSMTVKQAQERLASGKPCGYSILDITKMMKMGAKPNDTFFYDYSKTYGSGGVRYREESSIYKSYSTSNNVSVRFSQNGCSVIAEKIFNIESALSISYDDKMVNETTGRRFDSTLFFVGQNESSYLIGWDYSKEYDDYNGGSISGTLEIDRNWYNNTRDTVLVSGVVIASVSAITYMVTQIVGMISSTAVIAAA